MPKTMMAGHHYILLSSLLMQILLNCFLKKEPISKQRMIMAGHHCIWPLNRLI